MRLQIAGKRMGGKRSGTIMETLAVEVRGRQTEEGNAKITTLRTGFLRDARMQSGCSGSQLL